jgi:hypothetical protein
MEAQDIRGLMEAYSQVYETPEVFNEEVEDLQEHGGAGAAIVAQQRAQQKAQASSAKKDLESGKMLGIGGAAFGTQTGTSVKLNSAATKSQGRTVLDTARQNIRGGGLQRGNAGPADNKISLGGQTLYKAKLGGKDVYVGAKKPGAPAAPAKPAAPTTPAKPAAPTTPAKPAAPAAPAKPSPTAGQKPTTPATPAKPAGSAMDQWRAANPKLAAAADEKARIRGTQQTDNPLMKDMKSNLPMKSPSVQAPEVSKLGAGNQSLTQNPNALKAATPKPAATAAAKPTGFDLAKKGVNLAQSFDVFDVVLGHLLDEGYAETKENAIAMMANMSEEWRQSILEAHGIEFVNEAKKGDGNLANNYPPYDKVTRGDVIAGALGQDQKGGKKKKNKVTKEELQLDETRRDPRGRPASGPMSVYGGTGKDAGPGGWGNPKIDAMDAAQRRVKATKPAKMGMAADALFTKYSARQRGMEHGSQEGPGAKSPKRGGRPGRGANTDRGKGNAAARRMKEELEAWVNELIAEGYDLSDYTWDEVAEIYMEELKLLDEAEKPFPHEKVERKQKALRDKGGDALERRMKMGLARRRATEAEKTGVSQQDAGKGWYHAKEEVEQLDEISLKTKMKAYAASRDVDADYAYGSKVHDQGDRIKANIVKKHGKEAGEHAERHADVSNFGRKDASGKYKGLPKSRIEKSDYRTTASGKMHKQDQSELKRELRIRRGKKLRAADADDDN